MDLSTQELELVADALRAMEDRLRDMSDVSLHQCVAGARDIASNARFLEGAARNEQTRRDREWGAKEET